MSQTDIRLDFAKSLDRAIPSARTFDALMRAAEKVAFLSEAQINLLGTLAGLVYRDAPQEHLNAIASLLKMSGQLPSDTRLSMHISRAVELPIPRKN